jgi:hypothetical protein
MFLSKTPSAMLASPALIRRLMEHIARGCKGKALAEAAARRLSRLRKR